jgi:hypothetical protein
LHLHLLRRWYAVERLNCSIFTTLLLRCLSQFPHVVFIFIHFSQPVSVPNSYRFFWALSTSGPPIRHVIRLTICTAKSAALLFRPVAKRLRPERDGSRADDAVMRHAPDRAVRVSLAHVPRALDLIYYGVLSMQAPSKSGEILYKENSKKHITSSQSANKARLANTSQSVTPSPILHARQQQCASAAAPLAVAAGHTERRPRPPRRRRVAPHPRLLRPRGPAPVAFHHDPGVRLAAPPPALIHLPATPQPQGRRRRRRPPPPARPGRRGGRPRGALRRRVLRVLAGLAGPASVHVFAAPGDAAHLQRGLRGPVRGAPVLALLGQRGRPAHRRPGGARVRAVVREASGRGPGGGVLDGVLRVRGLGRAAGARAAARRGRHVKVRAPERPRRLEGAFLVRDGDADTGRDGRGRHHGVPGRHGHRGGLPGDP